MKVWVLSYMRWADGEFGAEVFASKKAAAKRLAEAAQHFEATGDEHTPGEHLYVEGQIGAEINEMEVQS